MNAIKKVTCTALIGLALIAQLMNPTRAYADGETPPPASETAATEEPAWEKPLPTEVVVTEKPIALDISAAQMPAEAPIEGRRKAPLTETVAPTEPATLAELLQRIPAETTVVVLDQYARPLPLAGQDAAALIATGDPVWCPAGQAPTPGANGCTVSYLTLTALVAAEGGSLAADGTIWITTGNIADVSAITIDGSTYTNWANYALTLQGGWDGVSGSTNVSSNSVFTAPIAISGWIGDVTINNLTVQNTNSTGLSVVTQGTVTASNITANGNAYSGAFLLGDSGVTLTGTNEFSNNADRGLWAVSNGDITLNDITANGNGWIGIDSEAVGTITASNLTANGNRGRGIGAALHGDSGVTVTGTNEFYGNLDTGLWVVSFGDITLNQAIASGNGLYGVNLYTYGNIIFNDITANENGWIGIYSQTVGTITASNLTANGNRGRGVGAALHGRSGVTMTGTNEFFGNLDSGLWAVSDGNITLNHSINDSVTANGNGEYGADLYSYFGSVTVTGTNQFNMNATHGLIVYSPIGITVTGENEFSSNGGNGLVVGSDGPITLNNVTGTGNTTDVFLFSPDSATINNSVVSSLDAEAVCGTLALNGVVASSISYPVVGEHSFVDTYGILRTIDCHPIIYVDGHLLGEVPVVAPAQFEFDLSCDSQTLYPVDLPNGDKVTIVCPVRGKALISRLDNTTIPDDLPAGYTYASAFSVSILQADEPIPVITEGGHVEVSFQIPSQQEGTYSILFWDNGTWVPLNDFLLGSDNNPQSSALNPGVATDTRTILSGVQMVTRNGVQRVEVSTNFPGIFVLAQH